MPNLNKSIVKVLSFGGRNLYNLHISVVLYCIWKKNSCFQIRPSRGFHAYADA